jgi:acylphosphatase
MHDVLPKGGKSQMAQRTHILENMKLKAKISGTRVHDVGYRVFLLKNAMNLALPGLSTYNWEEDGRQEVIALVEGDEARVASFLKCVESKKPELAVVSSVTYEDYEGEVGRASEVAMFFSFVQLDKAIPLLLDMRDDLKEMKGDIEAVRKNTDMIPQMSEDIKAVRKTSDATLLEIKAVRKATDATLDEIRAVRKTTDSTLDEIKGMREDIQPGYAMQFRQVQSDVRAIKDRLGMS